jgi:hemin uptake protein HemP
MSDRLNNPTPAEKTSDLAKATRLESTSAVANYRAIDLLQGQASALIHHDQQIYILRLTAQNKLILTK